MESIEAKVTDNEGEIVAVKETEKSGINWANPDIINGEFLGYYTPDGGVTGIVWTHKKNVPEYNGRSCLTFIF